MALTVKNEVLVRMYLVLAILVGPLAGLLTYRTLEIAVVDREANLEKGRRFVREVKIEAERGNIYSHNDNLLATSVPFFELHFDPFVAPPDVYYEKLDSLAYLLATQVNDNLTVGGWRDTLLAIRDTSADNHYVKIAESVDYGTLKRIEQFPIFNLGRYKGGLIARKKEERKRPFGSLASRTVGYKRETMVNGQLQVRKVGIEGAFDAQLAGKSGTERMFRVDPRQNIWLPTENLTSVEPTVGADVYTTLDVNMQDIAENALYRAMKLHQPEWGTAIVMDVETGAIRALANLGLAEDKLNYYEMFNYAIGWSTEPGSTFKLATILALLEDGHVTLDSEIDIENGQHTFYDDCEMTDSNVQSAKWDTISVQMAFEQSSNVGMAKLVDQHYKYSEFTQSLRRLHLDQVLDVEIEGEVAPILKDTTDDTWSLCTNPWMAIGYETRMTALQMLTLYNAVANNGRMMKPYLVNKVVREGKVLEEYRPTVIDKSIASRKTIEQVQLLLEGVVERGTAKSLKTSKYRFAGKTGTSQQNYGKRSGKKEYQASFAGYFPADNPRYSCIVVVYNPRNGSYYGSDVAGPIFREIADMAYNSMIDVHEPLNQGPRPVLYSAELPRNDAGKTSEIATIFKHLNINTDSLPSSEMVMVRGREDAVIIERINPANQKYPNVNGMRLRDAVYILENKGFNVHPQGVGRVVEAIWQKDSKGRPGKDVTLRLN